VQKIKLFNGSVDFTAPWTLLPGVPAPLSLSFAHDWTQTLAS